MTVPSVIVSAETTRTATETIGQREPAKIEDAARQFEALLLGQLLKAAQESSGGSWAGEEEDQSAGSVLQLAGEQFAQALAAQGGLGLARMVSAGLSAEARTRSSSPD
jgi:Rod binding domain-containing protein